MKDNLFERLTDLSIGTGSKTPLAAIDRIMELESVLHSLYAWINKDQEVLDNMTAAYRDAQLSKHKNSINALFNCKETNR